MISGIVLLSSLLLGANPPSSAPPADLIQPDAQELIERLRRPAPADTAYTEVRFVGMLQRPLLLHGTLHYGGVNQLGKRVDSPYRESTSIADGQVEVQREGKSARRFSLERAPELQALLAGFSALLSGDVASLNSYYVMTLEQTGASWRLSLTPREPGLAKHLRDIVVNGNANETRCFTLHEVDGDASVMLLGVLAGAKLSDPPTATALATICGASAP